MKKQWFANAARWFADNYNPVAIRCLYTAGSATDVRDAVEWAKEQEKKTAAATKP